jgi:hypothetical protein
MNLKFVTISLFCLGFAFSCAHHRDVRPGADGLHKVTARGPEDSSSARDALSQAQHFCKEQKKYAAIKTEDTKYTGSMDEDTRKTVKAASKAASMVGFMADNPHSKRNDTADVLSGAGAAGQIMTGQDDYVTTMTFICQ